MKEPLKMAHPPGHFYSPVCDPEQLRRDVWRIWPEKPEPQGLDFDDASHARVLDEFFPRWMPEYDFPEVLPDPPDTGPRGFYTQNSQFSWLDSRALFVLMRVISPKRIIEIGSGYSSMLMGETNLRHFGGKIDITCIEPYPRPFLERGLPGISRLIKRRVQDVPLETYSELRSDDILFIDSSHVSKTGSDVNHIYFEILPRLPKGVIIHIHDIHLPDDYSQAWAIHENRSWNEQYIVQAMLMFSTAFGIRFGCSYAVKRHTEKLRAALRLPGGRVFGGGSLWIERK